MNYCRYFDVQDNPNLPDNDSNTYFLKDEPIGVIGIFLHLLNDSFQ